MRPGETEKKESFTRAVRGLLWVKAGDLGESGGLLSPTITFSEVDILLTIDMKFVFFRNDHFYSQKVTPFRALYADSWVGFLR